MATATLTSKGQVTIPKELRDALQLETGDRLEFVLEPDGSVRVVPVTSSLKELKRLVPKPAKALTLDEMDSAIARGAQRK